MPAVCLLLTIPAGVHVQLIDLFRSYFEGALNENSIKRNFVLMYELLDEVMDFGFPQVTEPSVLKNFIFQKGIRGEVDLVSGVHTAASHTNPLPDPYTTHLIPSCIPSFWCSSRHVMLHARLS
jgi:hypothetical protein